MTDGGLNDQAMKEMAEQLKETYDEITFKLEKMESENIDLKKHLISAYGMARVMDNLIDECYEIQPEISTLSDVLRAYLSSVMDNTIFNVKVGNPP